MRMAERGGDGAVSTCSGKRMSVSLLVVQPPSEASATKTYVLAISEAEYRTHRARSHVMGPHAASHRLSRMHSLIRDPLQHRHWPGVFKTVNVRKDRKSICERPRIAQQERTLSKHETWKLNVTCDP